MTDEEIAGGLSAEEKRMMAWWARLPKDAAVGTRNSPPMESLHQKKLIWSPFWLAAIAPPWVCKRPWLLAVWRWFNRTRWTWWVPKLFYTIPPVGATKLGRRVASHLEKP